MSTVDVDGAREARGFPAQCERIALPPQGLRRKTERHMRYKIEFSQSACFDRLRRSKQGEVVEVEADWIPGGWYRPNTRAVPAGSFVVLVHYGDCCSAEVSNSRAELEDAVKDWDRFEAEYLSRPGIYFGRP